MSGPGAVRGAGWYRGELASSTPIFAQPILARTLSSRCSDVQLGEWGGLPIGFACASLPDPLSLNFYRELKPSNHYAFHVIGEELRIGCVKG